MCVCMCVCVCLFVCPNDEIMITFENNNMEHLIPSHIPGSSVVFLSLIDRFWMENYFLNFESRNHD